VVDAFAERAFSGNPAAVCLLEEPLGASLMQAIAAEMNLSETAFVTIGRPEVALRWFTPKAEVDLCGHATLASARVLWSTGRCEGPIRFGTRSGVLVATPRDGAVELDFPAFVATPVVAPAGLAEALGVVPQQVSRTRQDWLVEVAEAEQVRALQPDLVALGRLAPHTVIVSALDHGGSADFVSRVFAPGLGIDEDPVTGAAHCALGPYWGARLGRDELVGYQASPRGGYVRVALAGERVRLCGDAVIVLEGELFPGQHATGPQV
jgi:PhzF family phenazine biosynthesis protein